MGGVWLPERGGRAARSERVAVSDSAACEPSGRAIWRRQHVPLGRGACTPLGADSMCHLVSTTRATWRRRHAPLGFDHTRHLGAWGARHLAPSACATWALRTRHLAPSACATWRRPRPSARPRPYHHPSVASPPEIADARVGDDAAGVAAVAVDPDAAQAGLLGAGDVAQRVVADHDRVARPAADRSRATRKMAGSGLDAPTRPTSRSRRTGRSAPRRRASSAGGSSVPFVTTASRIRPLQRLEHGDRLRVGPAAGVAGARGTAAASRSARSRSSTP